MNYLIFIATLSQVAVFTEGTRKIKVTFSCPQGDQTMPVELTNTFLANEDYCEISDIFSNQPEIAIKLKTFEQKFPSLQDFKLNYANYVDWSIERVEVGGTGDQINFPLVMEDVIAMVTSYEELQRAHTGNPELNLGGLKDDVGDTYVCLTYKKILKRSLILSPGDTGKHMQNIDVVLQSWEYTPVLQIGNTQGYLIDWKTFNKLCENGLPEKFGAKLSVDEGIDNDLEEFVLQNPRVEYVIVSNLEVKQGILRTSPQQFDPIKPTSLIPEKRHFVLLRYTGQGLCRELTLSFTDPTTLKAKTMEFAEGSFSIAHYTADSTITGFILPWDSIISQFQTSWVESEKDVDYDKLITSTGVGGKAYLTFFQYRSRVGVLKKLSGIIAQSDCFVVQSESESRANAIAKYRNAKNAQFVVYKIDDSTPVNAETKRVVFLTIPKDETIFLQ